MQYNDLRATIITFGFKGGRRVYNIYIQTYCPLFAHESGEECARAREPNESENLGGMPSRYNYLSLSPAGASARVYIHVMSARVTK